MERREFLGALTAFTTLPMLSFKDIVDDSLTVNNYKLKLTGNYTVLDMTIKEKREGPFGNFSIRFYEDFLFSRNQDKVAVTWFKPRITEKTTIDGKRYWNGIDADVKTISTFDLQNEISADYCNEIFKETSKNFLIIDDDKLMGYSIEQKKVSEVQLGPKNKLSKLLDANNYTTYLTDKERSVEEVNLPYDSYKTFTVSYTQEYL